MLNVLRKNLYSFTVKTILFYFLALLLWVPIVPYYTELQVKILNAIYYHPPLLKSFQVEEKTRISLTSRIEVPITGEIATIENTFDMNVISSNIVLLLALILALPRLSYLKKLKLSGISIFILITFHLLDIVRHINYVEINSFFENNIQKSFFCYHVHKALHNFLSLAGRALFAIFLFIIVAAPYYRALDQKISIKNIKRNDPCPCGSNKKYKNCCGK